MSARRIGRFERGGTIARRMNEEVEIFVGPHPEQYTWILKLLKTRKPGDIKPYKPSERYPE